ncbi:YdiU family protein [Aurantivibrio infirmus]
MSSPLFSQLQFDNSFVRHLPGDPELGNFCRQVSGACYSAAYPKRVRAPQTVAYSSEVAQQLKIDPESPEFARVFSGNEMLPGMEPFAMCYGGHQFGNWAGQLGDGRAINLGEVLTDSQQRLTLQLKGAGPTPYSRNADGFAVLRSSVREFLCSEAMFHLGVPTTRALSLVTTGEHVERDMFYDGRAAFEPGAVVCRVAPSFIRFGSFEILAARNEKELLKQLVDYTIETHFPHLGKPNTDTYLRWFNEVCESTAVLIAHWMRVGFVHGVMNTDNMSIHGLTIDYGPYGWLENYDTDWTPNTTDAQGRRYRFGNQAPIAQWNLLQLANAIYPLIQEAEPLQESLQNFADSYTQKNRMMLLEKLGLTSVRNDDDSLIEDLQSVLKVVETDMTIFYRKLANISTIDEASNNNDDEVIAPLLDAYYQTEQLNDNNKETIATWLRRYQSRLRAESSDDETRRALMNSVNPKYVLRNYLAQLAIDEAEKGDNSLVNELLDVLRKPYDEQPGCEKYAIKRPDWARNRAGCSMLSCSS